MRLPQAIRQFASNALRDNPTRTIAVGPLLWTIEPGHDTRCWYFVVASANAAGYCRLDMLKAPVGSRNRGAKALAEEARAVLLAEVLRRKPPCVIHTFDGEISFAEFCATAWPSERTARIRDEVERELGGGVA